MIARQRPQLALAARVLLRQLAADRWAALLVVALVAGSAGLTTAAVRSLDAVGGRALRAAVDAAGPRDRDLSGAALTHLLQAPAGDPCAPYDAVVDRVAAGPVRDLPAVAGRPQWQLDSSLFGLTPTDPRPRAGPTDRLSLRAGSSWRERVRVVSGRWPQRASIRPDPAPPAAAALAGGNLLVPVVETLVSGRTAELMRLEVGDTVVMSSWSGDELLPRVGLTVVGLFEPVDRADEYWILDPSALTPRLVLTEGPLGTIYTGLAFVADEALAVLREAAPNASLALSVRVPVTSAALGASDATALAAAVRRATARSVPIALDDPAAQTLVLGTRLEQVLQTFLLQRAPVLALAGVLLAALLGMALVVLLLAVRLLLERRREALALAAARGAAARQLLAMLAVEGAVLGTSGAALGWLVTRGVIGSAGALEVAVPLAAVLAPAVVVPLSAARQVLAATSGVGAAGGVLRGARRDVWLRHRRNAGLVLLVALTVAAAAALRLRGLAATAAQARAAAQGADLDPLVLATPVLVSATVAVVLARLVVLPLRTLTRRLAAGRGLVGFLGIARATREGRVGVLATAGLVVALAVAVLAAATSVTIDRATTAASVRTVGADLRVSADLTADDLRRLAGVAGVEALAPLAVAEGVQASVPAGSARTLTVAVVATDTARLPVVQQGLPGAAPLPDVLRRPTAEQAAGRAVVPVLASAAVAPVGTDVGLIVRQRYVVARVVGRAPPLPGTPQTQPWVLADLTPLRAATGLVLPARDVLVRTADRPPDARLLEVVADPAARVSDAAQLRARLRASELVGAVDVGLPLALGVGAVYGSLAVVLTLLAGARSRGRFLAHLRALGLSGRQSGALVALEVVPTGLAAVTGGLLAGAVAVWLVLPAADLRPLTGSALAVTPQLPLALVGRAAAAFAVVLAVAVAGAAVAGRTVNPVTAARTVDGG